jgi:hypothetical protein
MTNNPHQIQDVNILGTTPLVAPADLKRELPLTDELAESVFN